MCVSRYPSRLCFCLLASVTEWHYILFWVICMRLRSRPGRQPAVVGCSDSEASEGTSALLWNRCNTLPQGQVQRSRNQMSWQGYVNLNLKHYISFFLWHKFRSSASFWQCSAYSNGLFVFLSPGKTDPQIKWMIPLFHYWVPVLIGFIAGLIPGLTYVY